MDTTLTKFDGQDVLIVNEGTPGVLAANIRARYKADHQRAQSFSAMLLSMSGLFQIGKARPKHRPGQGGLKITPPTQEEAEQFADREWEKEQQRIRDDWLLEYRAKAEERRADAIDNSRRLTIARRRDKRISRQFDPPEPPRIPENWGTSSRTPTERRECRRLNALKARKAAR